SRHSRGESSSPERPPSGTPATNHAATRPPPPSTARGRAGSEPSLPGPVTNSSVRLKCVRKPGGCNPWAWNVLSPARLHRRRIPIRELRPLMPVRINERNRARVIQLLHMLRIEIPPDRPEVVLQLLLIPRPDDHVAHRRPLQ